MARYFQNLRMTEIMDNHEINQGRRRFLVLTTAGAGGLAAAGVAAPFVASWFPSEKAKAAGAPVEIDVSKLGRLQKRNPLNQTERLGRHRHLYPLGLFADLPSRHCSGRFGGRVERRLLLPVPWLQIRHCRTRLRWRARPDQSGCSSP